MPIRNLEQLKKFYSTYSFDYIWSLGKHISSDPKKREYQRDVLSNLSSGQYRLSHRLGLALIYFNFDHVLKAEVPKGIEQLKRVREYLIGNANFELGSTSSQLSISVFEYAIPIFELAVEQGIHGAKSELCLVYEKYLEVMDAINTNTLTDAQFKKVSNVLESYYLLLYAEARDNPSEANLEKRLYLEELCKNWCTDQTNHPKLILLARNFFFKFTAKNIQLDGVDDFDLNEFEETVDTANKALSEQVKVDVAESWDANDVYAICNLDQWPKIKTEKEHKEHKDQAGELSQFFSRMFDSKRLNERINCARFHILTGRTYHALELLESSRKEFIKDPASPFFAEYVEIILEMVNVGFVPAEVELFHLYCEFEIPGHLQKEVLNKMKQFCLSLPNKAPPAKTVQKVGLWDNIKQSISSLTAKTPQNTQALTGQQTDTLETKNVIPPEQVQKQKAKSLFLKGMWLMRNLKDPKVQKDAKQQNEEQKEKESFFDNVINLPEAENLLSKAFKAGFIPAGYYQATIILKDKNRLKDGITQLILVYNRAIAENDAPLALICKNDLERLPRVSEIQAFLKRIEEDHQAKIQLQQVEEKRVLEEKQKLAEEKQRQEAEIQRQKVYGDKIKSHYDKGLQFIAEYKFDKAAAEFQELIQTEEKEVFQQHIKAKHVDAYLQLGNIYANFIVDNKKAEKCFQLYKQYKIKALVLIADQPSLNLLIQLATLKNPYGLPIKILDQDIEQIKAGLQPHLSKDPAIQAICCQPRAPQQEPEGLPHYYPSPLSTAQASVPPQEEEQPGASPANGVGGETGNESQPVQEYDKCISLVAC